MKKPLLYFLIFTLGTAFADSTVEHRSVTEPYVDPELKVSFPAKAGAFQKNEVSRSYNPMIGSKIRYSDHDGYCADVFLYTLPGKSNSIAPADLEVHYKTVKEAILKLNVQSPSINSVTLLEEKKQSIQKFTVYTAVFQLMWNTGSTQITTLKMFSYKGKIVKLRMSCKRNDAEYFAGEILKSFVK